MTVSVCLSVRAIISLQLQVRVSPIFVHITCDQSSSGGVAICYVLPLCYDVMFVHNVPVYSDAKRACTKSNAKAAAEGRSLQSANTLFFCCNDNKLNLKYTV